MTDVRARQGRNRWQTNAFQVLFQSDSFYFPVVAVLWLSAGLSLSKVALLQAIFAVALFVLDLPSGHLTDHWGRKRSLVFGAAALAMGTGAYAFADSFGGFVASELFLAVGFALISGADSSMLYDTLEEEGNEDDFKRLWGRAGSYRMVCTAAFNIIGALAVSVSLRMPFYLAFAGMSMSFLIALCFSEPRRKSADASEAHGVRFAKALRYGLVESAAVRRVIVFTATVSAFTLMTLWFYQPYFQLAGIDVAYYGFIFAGFQVIAAIAARYAHALHERLGKEWLLLAIVLLVAASYLLVGSFVYWFSIAFMFLLQFSRGMQGVLFSDEINRATAASMRSTMLSLSSSASTLVYAVLLLVFGYLADKAGLGMSFVIAGLVFAVIGITAWAPLRNARD